MSQKVSNCRVSELREMLWVDARWSRLKDVVTWVWKSMKSRMSFWSVRRRVVDAPQCALVHRHRVFPALVVPFFFIFPVQTGHVGRFLVIKGFN